MIIAGLYAQLVGGGCPMYLGSPDVQVGHHVNGLLTLRASSSCARAFRQPAALRWTGSRPSQRVSALRPPEGRNARQILVTQGSIVAFLIAGISWLAHITHAVPT